MTKKSSTKAKTMKTPPTTPKKASNGLCKADKKKVRMNIPYEKTFPPSTIGVYPRPTTLPTPYCCFRIMQIRTGASWLAYAEMVWITSQLSYWAAQAVTLQWPAFVIFAGILFTAAQIVLVILLLRGLQTFRLSFITIFLSGLLLRILIYSTYMLFALVILVAGRWDDEEFEFVTALFWIKATFCVCAIMFKVYTFYVVYRCYHYIVKTQSYFLNVIDQQSPIAIHQMQTTLIGNLEGNGTAPHAKPEALNA